MSPAVIAQAISGLAVGANLLRELIAERRRKGELTEAEAAALDAQWEKEFSADYWKVREPLPPS
jgi:hypothetical protein